MSIFPQSRPDYFPAFTSVESWNQALDQLTSVEEGQVLCLSGEGFQAAGKAYAFWQTVKGIFGFENLADSKKLGGRVLKFLFQGAAQGFIKQNAPRIEALKGKIDAWKVDQVVQRAFDQVGNLPAMREILEGFYNEHQARLQPAFWSSLSARKVEMLPVAPFGSVHLALAEQDRTQALVHYRLAAQVYNSEDAGFTDKVAQSFGRFVANAEPDPKIGEVYLCLAERKFQAEKNEEAVQFFDRAAENFAPFSPSHQALRFIAGAKSRNVADAVEFEVLNGDLQRGVGEAFLLLAEDRYRNERFGEAEDYFQKASQHLGNLDPNSIVHRFIAAAKAGRFNQAEALELPLVEVSDALRDAFLVLAKEKYRMGQFDQALGYFQKASQNSRALEGVEKARWLIAAANVDQFPIAENLSREISEFVPPEPLRVELATVYLRLANRNFRENNFLEAGRLFGLADRLGAQCEETERARWLIAASKTAQLDVVEKLSGLFPEVDRNLKQELGSLYLRMGEQAAQPEKAVRFFELASHYSLLDPRSKALWMISAAKIGRFDGAKRCANEISGDEVPEMGEAYLGLAQNQFESKNYKEADRFFRLALEGNASLSPAQTVHWMIASAKTGLVDVVERFAGRFSELLAKNPLKKEVVDAYLFLAEKYGHLGQFEPADRFFSLAFEQQAVLSPNQRALWFVAAMQNNLEKAEKLADGIDNLVTDRPLKEQMAHAYLVLAENSYRKDDFQQATRFFQQAFLQGARFSATQMALRVTAAARADQWPLAEELAQTISEMVPDETLRKDLGTVYLGLANRNYESDQHKSADIYFKRALESGVEVNDSQKARWFVSAVNTAQFEKSQKLAPDDYVAESPLTEQIGSAFLVLGDQNHSALADRFYQQASKRGAAFDLPQKARWMIALEQTNQLDKAEALVSKIAELEPDEPLKGQLGGTYLRLANSHFERRNVQEAHRFFSLATENSVVLNQEQKVCWFIAAVNTAQFGKAAELADSIDGFAADGLLKADLGHAYLLFAERNQTETFYQKAFEYGARFSQIQTAHWMLASEQSGPFQKALSLSRDLTDFVPEEGPLRERLGALYLRLAKGCFEEKQFLEAGRCFQRASENGASLEQTQKAQWLISAARTQQLEIVEKLAAPFPEVDPDLKRELGEIYQNFGERNYEANQPKRVVEFFELASQNTKLGERPQALWMISAAKIRKFDLARTLSSTLSSETQLPEEAGQAYLDLALNAYDSKKFEEADRFFRIAFQNKTEFTSDQTVSWVIASVKAGQLDVVDRFAVQFSEILSTHPMQQEIAQAYLALAEKASQSQQYAQSDRFFTLAAENRVVLNPKQKALWFVAAFLNHPEKAEKLAEGIDDLALDSPLKEQLAQGFVYLAQKNHQSGNFQQATRFFHQASLQGAEFSETQSALRVSAAAQADQWELAQELSEPILEIAPDEALKKELALVYLGLGNRNFESGASQTAENYFQLAFANGAELNDLEKARWFVAAVNTNLFEKAAGLAVDLYHPESPFKEQLAQSYLLLAEQNYPNNFVQAERFYKQASERGAVFDLNQKARWLVALEQTGQFERAESLSQEIAELKPEEGALGGTYLRLAARNFDLRRFAEAGRFFQQAAKQGAPFTEAQKIQRFVVSAHTNQFELAEQLADVIDLYENGAFKDLLIHSYLLLAEKNYENGRFDLAQRFFNQASQRGSNFEPFQTAHWMIASERTAQYQSAINLSRGLSHFHPQEPLKKELNRVYLALAKKCYEDEQLKEAGRLFQMAYENGASLDQAHNALWLISAAKTAQLDVVERLSRPFEEIDPTLKRELGVIYQTHAEHHFNADRFQKAADFFDLASQQLSLDQPFKALWMISAAKIGKFEIARKLSGQISQTEPLPKGMGPTYLALAQHHFESGHFENADKAFSLAFQNKAEFSPTQNAYWMIASAKINRLDVVEKFSGQFSEILAAHLLQNAVGHAYLSLAEKYANGRQFDKSERFFRLASENKALFSPNQNALWFISAAQSSAFQRAESLVDQINESFGFESQLASAYLLLAENSQGAENFEKASRFFEKATLAGAKVSLNQKALWLIASVHIRQFKKAESLADEIDSQAIAISSDLGEAYLLLAEEHQKAKNFEAAQRFYHLASENRAVLNLSKNINWFIAAAMSRRFEAAQALADSIESVEKGPVELGQAYLLLAEEQYLQKNYPQAVRFYQKGSFHGGELHPNQEGRWFAAAANTRQLDLAEELSDRIEKLAPESPLKEQLGEAYLLLAEKNRLADNWPQVERFFRLAFDRGAHLSVDQKALWFIAAAHNGAQNGKLTDAEKLLNEVAAGSVNKLLHKQLGRAQLALGENKYRLNQFEEADLYFQQARLHGAEFSGTHNALAFISAAKNRQFDRAQLLAQEINSLLNDGPFKEQLGEAYLLLAVEFYRLNNYEQAQKFFLQAHKNNAEFSQQDKALWLAAAANTNRLDGTEQISGDIIDVETKRELAATYIRLGEEQFGLENYQKAVEFFLKASQNHGKLNEKQISLWLISAARTGRFEEAAILSKQISVVDPNDPLKNQLGEAYLSLAENSHGAEQFADSELYFQSALQREAILNERQKVLWMSARVSNGKFEAVEQYPEALSSIALHDPLAKKLGEACLKAAERHFELKQFVESDRFFQFAIQLGSGQTATQKAHWLIAAINQRRFETAERLYRELKHFTPKEDLKKPFAEALIVVGDQVAGKKEIQPKASGPSLWNPFASRVEEPLQALSLYRRAAEIYKANDLLDRLEGSISRHAQGLTAPNRELGDLYVLLAERRSHFGQVKESEQLFELACQHIELNRDSKPLWLIAAVKNQNFPLAERLFSEIQVFTPPNSLIQELGQSYLVLADHSYAANKFPLSEPLYAWASKNRVPMSLDQKARWVLSAAKMGRFDVAAQFSNEDFQTISKIEKEELAQIYLHLALQSALQGWLVQNQFYHLAESYGATLPTDQKVKRLTGAIEAAQWEEAEKIARSISDFREGDPLKKAFEKALIDMADHFAERKAPSRVASTIYSLLGKRDDSEASHRKACHYYNRALFVIEKNDPIRLELLKRLNGLAYSLQAENFPLHLAFDSEVPLERIYTHLIVFKYKHFLSSPLYRQSIPAFTKEMFDLYQSGSEEDCLRFIDEALEGIGNIKEKHLRLAEPVFLKQVKARVDETLAPIESAIHSIAELSRLNVEHNYFAERMGGETNTSQLIHQVWQEVGHLRANFNQIRDLNFSNSPQKLSALKVALENSHPLIDGALRSLNQAVEVHRSLQKSFISRFLRKEKEPADECLDKIHSAMRDIQKIRDKHLSIDLSPFSNNPAEIQSDPPDLIDPEGNLAFDVGAKLYSLRGEILLKKEGATSRVLESFKWACNLALWNPFGIGALFLEDHQKVGDIGQEVENYRQLAERWNQDSKPKPSSSGLEQIEPPSNVQPVVQKP